MWGYVGRRLVLAIPTLLGASIIVFAMVHLAPGDPISAVLPVDASKEQIEDIKKSYGFDKPLPVQYLKWLGHVVTGDLGKSIATRRAVILDVRDSLANSLVLALSSSVLAFGAGIALGLLAAFRQGRALDKIASAMTSILTAVGTAMREAQQDKTRATLAGQAIGWVKPLVALAGGIINGATEADVETIMGSR